MPREVNLSIAQFSPKKGDFQHNLTRLGDLFEAASHGLRGHVLHLPETALTGYFLEGGVREQALDSENLAEQLNQLFRSRVSGAKILDVVIGFYEMWQDSLHNSAMYVTLGGPSPIIRHIHRKVFLPTYGLFDEERFVERGFEVRAFDTSWGRAAILICEDAWHSITGTIAALDGAQVIFLSAAAPARGLWPRKDDTPGPYTLNRWERLARDIAEEHGVYLSLAHLVGSEGGRIFAGGSAIVGPRGELLARAATYREDVLSATLPLNELSRARADMPLLSDLRVVLPRLAARLGKLADEGVPTGTARDVEQLSPPRQIRSPGDQGASGSTHPDAGAMLRAGGPPSLELDSEAAQEMLVSFIRDEFASRGYSRAVIGLSGGVDSAVAAYLAARALGAENVYGVMMPYRTSSPDSEAHARLVIEASGITDLRVDISAAVDGYLSLEPDADDTRRGNVMARMRMIVLFDLAARYRALPVGTGNKTERLLGYFTWHADDSPPVNPLGDLYKTQVWELARFLGVPAEIIDKPASADLVQGQTDEKDLGVSYAMADQVLNWLLSGYTPTELVARGFDSDVVTTVAKRLSSTHWKRKLPTVAMLSPTAIGESYLRPVDWRQ